MKIQTLGNRLQLKVEEPKAGGLALDSMPVAVECGEVIGIGSEVTLPVKLGDRVFFKAWAVDIISHGGKKYHFISEDTKGLCAIIK